jgi:hypothetical protein
MGQDLLLVGSVPLKTVEDVMRTFGGAIGPYLPLWHTREGTIEATIQNRYRGLWLSAKAKNEGSTIVRAAYSGRLRHFAGFPKRHIALHPLPAVILAKFARADHEHASRIAAGGPTLSCGFGDRYFTVEGERRNVADR